MRGMSGPHRRGGRHSCVARSSAEDRGTKLCELRLMASQTLDEIAFGRLVVWGSSHLSTKRHEPSPLLVELADGVERRGHIVGHDTPASKTRALYGMEQDRANYGFYEQFRQVMSDVAAPAG